MDYEGWKKIMEPVSLLFMGATSLLSFQKVFRSFRGSPPCGPSEDAKVILAELETIKSRLSVVEQKEQASPGK